MNTLLKIIIFGCLVLNCLVASAKSAQADCSYVFPSEIWLEPAESCRILKEIGLDYDPISKKLFDHSARTCGPIDFSAKSVNLSQQPDRYIVILFGNICSAGMAGTNFVLLEKSSSGAVRKVAEAAAVSKVIISAKVTNAHNELLLYGSGRCHAIWIWENGKYKFFNEMCK